MTTNRGYAVARRAGWVAAGLLLALHGASMAAPPGLADPAPAASDAAAPRQSALGCLIEASAVADVGAPVIGVLQSVAVERGDVVRKGQVLAQFDAGVERAAVLLAQARHDNEAEILAARSQHAYAEKKAERTAMLTELKFVSSQARDQADTEASMAQMKVAQAHEQRALAAKELQLARAQLALRTIVSPLSGVVVERHASVGERIENRPIVKVAQLDPLRVEVVMPASQFHRIKPGMGAQVQPELAGVEPRSATVSIVDRVIDAASNTFRVRLSLPNPGLGLPAGLRCSVRFAP